MTSTDSAAEAPSLAAEHVLKIRRIRARLRALIFLSGFTYLSLANAMGKSRTAWSRKFDPETTTPRELTLDDADEILAFLRQPRSILDAPILTATDRGVLEKIGSQPETLEALLLRLTPPDPARPWTLDLLHHTVVALSDQELVTFDGQRVSLPS